jgi:hypothetical protein
LIYVAGPFSPTASLTKDVNIAHAKFFGLRVAKFGGMPVIPHTNTGHDDFELVQSYEFYLVGTARLMTRCDGVLFVPGWRESRGAKSEHDLAEKIGMPMFEAPLLQSEHADRQLIAWISSLAGEIR